MAPEDWFIFLGVIALIPATIAYRKDRSFIAWWFEGLLSFTDKTIFKSYNQYGFKRTIK